MTNSCCNNNSTKDVSRRGFLKSTAGAAAFAAFGDFALNPKMVFAKHPLQNLIPFDKDLSHDWINSLTERSKPEIFKGWEQELKYIDMPVGGMGCGQLYIGGDGQLWHWDIFKSNYDRDPSHGERLDSMGAGGHYAEPIAQGEVYHHRSGAEVEQGFALRIMQNEKVTTRKLNRHEFPDVAFRGEYPVSKINYADDNLPLDVSLKAFSPFVPLDEKDSALPVTVMSFTLKNTSKSAMSVDLMGWLENAVCPYSQDTSIGQRKNWISPIHRGISVVSELTSNFEQDDLAEIHGHGSMALSVLNQKNNVTYITNTNFKLTKNSNEWFSQLTNSQEKTQYKEMDKVLLGAINAQVTLKPGESQTIDFAISWYFPDYAEYSKLTEYYIYSPSDFYTARRHYAARFSSALDVAKYLSNHQELIDNTLLWNKTWYDSTLPHWLLDRSFIAINCMATQVFHWFDNDRPYAWEGVDCCPGTCTHVWHYAQGLGRVFPGLERRFREQVDYGIGFNKSTGEISARGEIIVEKNAIYGHAGTILRMYREHQISADNAFLKRLWPKVRHSTNFLMSQDEDESGLLRGRQYNTLDAAWYGPMGWISSLYLAALRAAEAMATEMGDIEFSILCSSRIQVGKKNLVSELFNGEYFIHEADSNYPNAIRSGIGCHIDQVLGQAWINQINLEKVIPKSETISALNSL